MVKAAASVRMNRMTGSSGLRVHHMESGERHGKPFVPRLTSFAVKGLFTGQARPCCPCIRQRIARCFEQGGATYGRSCLREDTRASVDRRRAGDFVERVRVL